MMKTAKLTDRRKVGGMKHRNLDEVSLVMAQLAPLRQEAECLNDPDKLRQVAAMYEAEGFYNNADRLRARARQVDGGRGAAEYIKVTSIDARAVHLALVGAGKTLCGLEWKRRTDRVERYCRRCNALIKKGGVKRQ